MQDDRPNLDPYPLSDYVAWAGRRNRDPILEAFRRYFPTKPGHVLELASGSGMHINYFAPHFQYMHFQPSDMDEDVFENIKKLRAEQGNPNVIDPIKLDLTKAETWPNPRDQRYDVIFCINIFQVAPVSIADGMMQCGAAILKDTGFLSIYGPFKVEGHYTTGSNEAFDKEVLSAGVPEWGLKDVADLNAAAEKHGLRLQRRVDMPANNFLLMFERI
jgi:hypothetical protein